MKKTNKMPSFEGVASGGTATCRLTLGMTFEKLLLTYSGVTLAQMTEIRLVANGKVFQRIKGAAMLDKINVYDRMTAADGILPITFQRHGLKTKAGLDETIIGTGYPLSKEYPFGVTTFHVEIDIHADASAPVFELRAVQSAPRPLTKLLKRRQFGYNAPASGEYEISDLPKGDIYNRVIFDNANITRLEVLRNGSVIFDRTRDENELLQKDGVRTPQSGYFVFDPTEEGHGSEIMVTRGVQDLRFRLTLSDAGAIPVMLESIGLPI